MLELGLGAGERVRRIVQYLTQYVVRIETLMTGFSLEGILPGSDFVPRGYVRKEFWHGFQISTQYMQN